MTNTPQKQPASYDDVALVAPVTVPYERFSEHGAQWFFGRALAELVKGAGLDKKDIDGLAVSSFTLAPDSVITLTQYFSLTPRWIEQIPLGGASGVVALRRAARAVQSGDAEVIACIGADTNKKEGFRELVEKFLDLFRRRSISLRGRRPQRRLFPDHPALYGQVWRHAGGFRPHRPRPAP